MFAVKILVFIWLSIIVSGCDSDNKTSDGAEQQKMEAKSGNSREPENNGKDNKKKEAKPDIVRTYTRPDASKIESIKQSQTKRVPIQIRIWVDESVMITDEGGEVKLSRGDSLTAYSRKQNVLDVRTRNGVLGKLEFCDTNYGLLVASGSRMAKALSLPEANATKRKYFECWNAVREDKSKGIVIQGPVKLKASPAGKDLNVKYESWQIVRILESKVKGNELWYKMNAGQGKYGWISAHHVLGGQGNWGINPVVNAGILLENNIVSNADKFKMSDLWLVSADFTKAIPRIIGKRDKTRNLNQSYVVTMPLDGMNWVPKVELFLFSKEQLLEKIKGDWKPVIYKGIKKDMQTNALPGCKELPVNLNVSKNGFGFSFGKQQKLLKFDSIKMNDNGSADLLQKNKKLATLIWIGINKQEIRFIWDDSIAKDALENNITNWTRLGDEETLRAEKRIRVLLECDKEQ